MNDFLTTPKISHLPELPKKAVLFFNLNHLFMFRELVGGSKIKSFGPSRRFGFRKNGETISVLGGMIGAPLAAITVEHALAAGSERFFSFGSAGWIGKEQRKIGELVAPEKGFDDTGMTRDYGGAERLSSFAPPDIGNTTLNAVNEYARFRQFERTTQNAGNEYARSRQVVSINSFYALTKRKIENYREREIDLIDMESAPLNFIVKLRGGSLTPLFAIADLIDENFQWRNGDDTKEFDSGIEAGLEILLDCI